MPSTFQKLRQTLSEKGLRKTMAYLPERAFERMRQRQEREYDSAYAIDTCGINRLRDLAFESENRLAGHRYEGVPIKQFRRMLERLRIDYSQYTFIDYGSGKGRALFIAAERPFKRIIGVEFAPMLHEDAVRNIASFRHPGQRCVDIQSVCADAVGYQPPPGPIVCFFYSPFKPPVLDRALTTLKRELDLRPRPAVLLFFGHNPESVRLFEDRWPQTTSLPLPYDPMSRGNYSAWVTRIG